MAVRAKLRKETDPEFWRELIASENPVPSEIDRQTEDIRVVHSWHFWSIFHSFFIHFPFHFVSIFSQN